MTMTIISAPRSWMYFLKMQRVRQKKGLFFIIAGAGRGKPLPGGARNFPMPVIGIPMHTTSLGEGIPVQYRGHADRVFRYNRSTASFKCGYLVQILETSDADLLAR